MNNIKVTFVGAGNLATNLALTLKDKGVEISQVFSRTMRAARELAERVGARAIDRFEEIDNLSDIYIVALKDDALLTYIDDIIRGKEDKLWVHTAGSIPMDIFAGKTEHYGVFYPMQTFSKSVRADFTNLPIFVEACGQKERELLENLGERVSNNVRYATSEQRKHLHLAAVFVCNFTNHLYTIAEEILEEKGMPFTSMLGLIDETTRKVHSISPHDAQTGPAIRNDREVMNSQLQLINTHKEWQNIYTLMSEDIHKTYLKNKEKIK